MENMFDLMLFFSAVSGDLEGARAALANGGRVGWRSPQGLTPLHVAAQNGRSNICALLLEAGSNVNEIAQGARWWAPLHEAALRGNEASVEVLLSWGAAVDQKDAEGMTPLNKACRQAPLTCVLSLLKAGASFSLPSHDGYLPIHNAAQHNRVDIVKSLLELGCSPNMVS